MFRLTLLLLTLHSSRCQYLSVHTDSTTTTNVLRLFFRDHPGEPVPEENFWTLWCKERLTEADTPTIRGRHSIRTKPCPPPPSPIFFTGRIPFLPPNQQCQSTEGTDSISQYLTTQHSSRLQYYIDDIICAKRCPSFAVNIGGSAGSELPGAHQTLVLPSLPTRVIPLS